MLEHNLHLKLFYCLFRLEKKKKHTQVNLKSKHCFEPLKFNFISDLFETKQTFELPPDFPSCLLQTELPNSIQSHE